MLKERIYEIAKELNMKSADLAKLVKEIGIEGKSYMSVLDEGELNVLFEHLTQHSNMDHKTLEDVFSLSKKEEKETETKKSANQPENTASTKKEETASANQKEEEQPISYVATPAKQMRHVDTRQNGCRSKQIR